MKLLIPVSYFFNQPRSEIWQLDTETKTKTLQFKLPTNPLPVNGKGITCLSWLDSKTLVGCDFNSVFLIDWALKNVTKISQAADYNDLHHLSVNLQNIAVANTGRDRLEIFNYQLQYIDNIDLLSTEEVDIRLNGRYELTGDYYDSDISDKPFNQRKVPDKYHVNHVIQDNKALNSNVIATSFKRKVLLNAHTLEVISNELPTPPHDGFIHNEFIWVTTVSGQLYRSRNSIPFKFEPFYNLFKHTKFKGWCRGLLIEGNDMFIAITAIYENSDRTSWLDCSIENTKSGIYQIDLSTLEVKHFFDFSHEDGSRLFSIILSQHV